MNNDMLSQEEIDSLLNGTDEDDDMDKGYEFDNIMTEMEKDTLGEIGNISMGTAATTLSTLLNRKVVITTPKVMVTSTGELSYEYPIPFVAVDVRYKEGLEGANVLMINVDDVKIITDTMMGKDETEIDMDRELTEMDLSAISEVMNQMMGSACTSLSEIFMKKIDIAPPQSAEITFDEGSEILDVLASDDPIIKVSFRMVVEDLIDSELMQLIPLDFGQSMVKDVQNGPNNLVEEDIDMDEYDSTNDMDIGLMAEDIDVNENRKKDLHIEKNNHIEKEHVIVKNPEFETFDSSIDPDYDEPIDLVGDIPVELTVELGRTTKKIGEILSYGPGTIVELDKLLGEPLNVYANGKYIARGEVVVIDDNFGIRITDVEKS